VARALAGRPEVVFADEPTGALDTASAASLLSALAAMCRNLGQTVVMVTHDVEAAALADSVAVMSQGRLAEWSTARDARVIAELVHTVRAL